MLMARVIGPAFQSVGPSAPTRLDLAQMDVLLLDHHLEFGTLGDPQLLPRHFGDCHWNCQTGGRPPTRREGLPARFALRYTDSRGGSMGIEDILKERREDILRIAALYGARNVRIFGSAARGEARPDSDLDLLVEMAPGRTLLDVIAIEQDLEDVLGRKVDVLTEGAISPYLRETVLREAVAL